MSRSSFCNTRECWAGAAPKGRAVGTTWGNAGHKISESGKRTMRVVYEAVAQALFVYLSGPDGTLHQVHQSHLNAQKLFDAARGGRFRVGFTASSGVYHSTEARIHSFSMRRLRASPAQCKILQKGRVVGAVQDAASRPYRIDIDARDSCGHDRRVGGESWRVSMRPSSQKNATAIVVRSSDGCPEAPERSVGVCDNGDGVSVFPRGRGREGAGGGRSFEQEAPHAVATH